VIKSRPKSHVSLATIAFRRPFICSAATKGLAHRVRVFRPVGPDALGRFYAVRALRSEAFLSFVRDELNGNTALAFVIDDGAGNRHMPCIPLTSDIWASIASANGGDLAARIIDEFISLL
jgi:hypothetical protein